MDILDDMGASKLSAKVFSKVNYSFNIFFCRKMMNRRRKCELLQIMQSLLEFCRK